MIQTRIIQLDPKVDVFKTINDYSVDFEPAIFVSEAFDENTGENLVSIVEHYFKIEISQLHEDFIPFLDYEIITRATGDATWSADGQIIYRNDSIIIEELGEDIGVGAVSTNPIKKVFINVYLGFVNVKTTSAEFNVPSYEFAFDVKLLNLNEAV